jgi:putative transposase
VTTDSKHKFAVAENKLKRDFKPSEMGKAWVSDITYIKTQEGWLYLTTVLDLADRKVIGWALSNSMHASKTTVPALRMAVRNRTVTPGLIFHSDRGVQYACTEFTNVLKAYNIEQSMSRKGDCWDNAVAESFFKTLKTECVYRRKFANRKEAEIEIFEYIEVWYNRKRRHSALGYRTPAEMEQLLLNYQLAA